MNRATNDLYICDHEKGIFSSKGKIIAVSADQQLRYEYCGQGDEPFTPVNLCADQIGRLLITDVTNHRIHILDQKGQFIQYIFTKEQVNFPEPIDVDGDGYVWVGQDKLVMVARYLL